MDKYHIISGNIRFCCQARDLEDSFVIALRSFPLTRFSQVIGGYVDGNEENASWGLTEWYLEKAGYEPIGNGLYRWRKDPNDGEKVPRPKAEPKPKVSGKPVWVITGSLSRFDAINFAQSLPKDEYYLLKISENSKARHIAKRERFVVCRFPHKDEKIPEGSARIVDVVNLEKLT